MTEPEAKTVKAEYEQSMELEMQELLDYDKELRREFKDAEPNEDTARRTTKRMIELVPDAANQIKYLITHAESEAVRKDLAKWVLTVSMAHGEVVSQNDDMRNLLDSLTSPSSKKLGH